MELFLALAALTLLAMMFSFLSLTSEERALARDLNGPTQAPGRPAAGRWTEQPDMKRAA